MNRTAFLLLFADLACAMLLVNAQYRSRTLFVELERAEAAGAQLKQMQARLQYEIGDLGKSARVAEIARNQLHMQLINPSRTQYLSLPAVPAPAGASE